MIDSVKSENFNCEYLVIGSGAGGSVACKYLTDRGKDVLLIEEGQHYKINEFNNSISKSFLYAWRNAGITPIFSKTSYGFGEGRCLGGGTYINGGLIWRTPKIILDNWNQILKTNKFHSDNLKKYFDEIENNLELNFKSNNNVIENKESSKLVEIGKKYQIKVEDVPRSINAIEETNKLTLGAPGQTKNSILQKYIYKSKENGLRILTNCKAEKLIIKNNIIKTVKAKIDNKEINISANKVILACGATQTPMLVKKSFGNNFLISEMDVHLNLRVGVRFKDSMQAVKGKMFTKQIQEYLNDGVLIMPTSFNKNNFFSGLAKMDNNSISEIEKNIDNYANFVIQFQSKSKVNLNRFHKTLIPTYDLSSQDLLKIKKYFTIFCDLLFGTGAEEIILPLKKNYTITQKLNWKNLIDINFVPRNIEMVSVHGMSSAKMGIQRSHKEIFGIDGRSFDFKNMYCVDSSILPTGTIESPQATIMAVSSQILEELV